MATYIIQGGNKLNGKVRIAGNKNAVLPCLAATLLTSEPVTLTNAPQIRDVKVLSEILREIGAEVTMDGHSITVTATKITSTDLPHELTNKLRGSVLLAGSLLSRAGEVSFYHPGGDVIGKRGIDLHLQGFKQLGYQIEAEDRKYVITQGERSIGENIIFLDLPTVTGTENLILSSVLKEGITIIRNAAQEPHVVDLCNLLNKMGANIKGVNSPTLEINGVAQLHGTEYEIGPDNIEFGTYAIAAAITQGEVELTNCKSLDVEPLIWPMKKMGINFEKTSDGFKVSAEKLSALPTLTANFWPGFPTDLMSVMIILATQASGVSLLRDFIYESRMFFVDKLIHMGANIIIADPHRVFIYGPSDLVGRELETPDIRAGMAMVLAGLVASGESIIHKAELIERGYENPVETLSALGATIKRVED